MTIDSSIHGQRWPQLHIETVYNQPSKKYNQLKCLIKVKNIIQVKIFQPGYMYVDSLFPLSP